MRLIWMTLRDLEKFINLLSSSSNSDRVGDNAIGTGREFECRQGRKKFTAVHAFKATAPNSSASRFSLSVMRSAEGKSRGRGEKAEVKAPFPFFPGTVTEPVLSAGASDRSGRRDGVFERGAASAGGLSAGSADQEDKSRVAGKCEFL